MSVDEIIAEIEKLNVLDFVQLSKSLQERWGVSAAPVAVAAAGTAPAQTEQAPVAPVEEKTEFDVILTDVGSNKIQVIKAVRELTQLGLKEAKAVVDEAPKPVVEGVSKEDADNAAKKLADAGAKVEIK